MNMWHVIVLALVQGFTELLPISSSAHLILVPSFLGWPDQGLEFDLALHTGTLFAVLTYFRQDVSNMLFTWLRHWSEPKAHPNAYLMWVVLLATIPAGIAGLVGKDWVETHLRSEWIIACTSLGYGLLLGIAYSWGKKHTTITAATEITLTVGLIIGFAQVLALVPGTSRSGITMTAALFCGVAPILAARFSFLLSIPLITASSLLLIKDLLVSPLPIDWLALLVGCIVSALSAFVCIHWFLQLLTRIGMWPFAIYRVLLGIGLLFWLM
ncbi:MAG: undecaprenyl-diphosphate phosphatase [Gammaproteobacteria bacterium]|nr:undecaprenyl-diphosphate phosphatase [Gammaproteobacteria bacterium]